MNNFFTNLRKQVSFHLTNSDSEEACSFSNDVPGALLVPRAQTPCENMDDGEFAVIDAPDNEFSLFRRSLSSEKKYTDSPPTYRQVSETDELPSYQSVLNGSCTIVSGPSMLSRADMSSLIPDARFPAHNLKSTLDDIPFQLHPSLEIQLNAEVNFDDIDLAPLSFDWSKHSHDFTNENLCLRDMNSDEMANIDDFVIPLSCFQSDSMKASKDSDVDLIHF